MVRRLVIQDSLDAVINTIPAIRINDNVTETPKFDWGDKAELNRYLKLKGGSAYPLIWLLPSSDAYTNNGQQADKDCTFVIATRETRHDMFNRERYKNSFATVLNPLFDYLVHGLKVSTITNVNDLAWDVFDFPNYAEADKNYTIDLWDAIQLTISVRFNQTSNCLKTISYDEL